MADLLDLDERCDHTRNNMVTQWAMSRARSDR